MENILQKEISVDVKFLIRLKKTALRFPISYLSPISDSLQKFLSFSFSKERRFLRIELKKRYQILELYNQKRREKLAINRVTFSLLSFAGGFLSVRAFWWETKKLQSRKKRLRFSFIKIRITELKNDTKKLCNKYLNIRLSINRLKRNHVLLLWLGTFLPHHSHKCSQKEEKVHEPPGIFPISR